MGRFAVQSLLPAASRSGACRRVHQYQGVPLIVTYTGLSAAQLADKARAWEDLCLARETLLQQRPMNPTHSRRLGAAAMPGKPARCAGPCLAGERLVDALAAADSFDEDSRRTLLQALAQPQDFSWPCNARTPARWLACRPLGHRCARHVCICRTSRSQEGRSTRRRAGAQFRLVADHVPS